MLQLTKQKKEVGKQLRTSLTTTPITSRPEKIKTTIILNLNLLQQFHPLLNVVNGCEHYRYSISQTR